MSLFNTIRSLFGFKAEVEESQQPIDLLDDITSQLSDKKSELVKAQREFDEINSELTLKLKACDKLIEKGVKEGEFNKNVIQQRLDKITDEFLTNIQTLSKQVSELEQQKVQVEGDILAKAIDLTSRLTKAEQQEINDIIVTWKETSLIKGQEITSHTRAIVTALDEIVKSGSKEIKKSHEPLAIELAGRGDVIYDSPVEGHYANAIVCKYIKGEKYILFLKRAADKVVEPGKWCLPGGHIDEGETIEQAAARELKEEANLDSTGGYVRGKAKCDDGKWAFYVEISPDSHSLALLDGESQNATWMCREEWIEADLIFDLKDHLVAMESRSVNIKDIPDIMNPDTLKKSEDDSDLEKSIDIDNPFYYDSEDDLIKGRAAAEGEERTWGGKKYKKQGGKWVPVGSGKKGGGEASSSQEKGVIGKTSSGKSIYADPYHPSHDSFTKQDHKEASEQHIKKYRHHDREFERSGDKDEHHGGMSKYHHHASNAHDNLSKLSKQGQERERKMAREGQEKYGVDFEKFHEHADLGSKDQGDNNKQQPKSLSPKQLKEHVENTSTEQLKKVAGNKDHPHNDAAKRELERRDEKTNIEALEEFATDYDLKETLLKREWKLVKREYNNDVKKYLKELEERGDYDIFQR